MLPVIQVGPLALPVPQFSILLALWLGLSLAERYAYRREVSPDEVYNLVFTGLVAGLLGARLGYVLQYPSAFAQSPLSLISVNLGLLDPFIGYAAGLVAMAVYGQRKKMPLWNTLDALTPLLGVLAFGLAVSHIGSGEAFGAETSLPWGISLWGARRQPSQFYELASAILILIITYRNLKSDLKPGVLFLGFVAMNAAARLFLEAFRGDSLTLPGGFREAQIIAWLIFTSALVFLDIIRRKA